MHSGPQSGSCFCRASAEIWLDAVASPCNWEFHKAVSSGDSSFSKLVPNPVCVRASLALLQIREASDGLAGSGRGRWGHPHLGHEDEAMSGEGSGRGLLGMFSPGPVTHGHITSQRIQQWSRQHLRQSVIPYESGYVLAPPLCTPRHVIPMAASLSSSAGGSR